MVDTLQSFNPDWASPPGDTIADLLEERDWTQAQLAERLGYTTKHVSQLINGKAPVTEETALKLERVLGTSAASWLNREAQYRTQLAKLEEQSLLSAWVSWLDELPVKELMHQGIIPNCRLDAKNKPGVVKELLSFFGVASPDDWRTHYVGMNACFRKARPDQCDTGAISAWLRLGEMVAEQQSHPCRYNKVKFQRVVKKIRDLTVLSPAEFMPQMQQLCREAGVVLVFVPSIPKAKTSGVARWLNAHKPLIQLSLYGKSNDKFWFNFFHEVAHVLLHDTPEQKKSIFLDDGIVGAVEESQQEAEANQWAREFLIPSKYDAVLPSLKSKDAVAAFAKDLGIHPAIVVGRLQYEGAIPMNWMNDLKESLNLMPKQSDMTADDVRYQLAELEISEDDLEDAIAWARH
jgi:HTH-type transcriptional regulator / antitoxin HigA